MKVDKKTIKIAKLTFQQNGLIQEYYNLLREKPMLWRIRAAGLKILIKSLERDISALKQSK